MLSRMRAHVYGITRRRFCGLAGGLVAAVATETACQGWEQRSGDGARLTARPLAGVTTSGTARRSLDLDRARDALLQLPHDASTAALPLLVLLHGAGGSGEGILRRLGSYADDAGVAVLAPDSRDSTWDAVRGGFGPDVAFLQRALERVFATTAVDPSRVAVGGFSDGASYAISLGLANGDLFTRVVAFSPGFYVGGAVQGRPRFFISHGSSDEVLPIDRCSRVIVPRLKKQGYDVTFREFDGGHEVPPDVAMAGFRWARG
jgi:predicted esterase